MDNDIANQSFTNNSQDGYSQAVRHDFDSNSNNYNDSLVAAGNYDNRYLIGGDDSTASNNNIYKNGNNDDNDNPDEQKPMIQGLYGFINE